MSIDAGFESRDVFRLMAAAIIALVVGAGLAAALLVNLPVKEVTEIPDEVRPAVHYILKGRTAGGDAWKLKAAELQQGKPEVTLLETEMNRWASTFVTDYPEEKPSIYIEPQKPIFRLEGDELLVSAKADTALGAWKKSIILSLEGEFIPDDDSLYIRPEKLFVGSLRLPGLLKNLVWKEISGAYTIGQEFQTLWSSIETVDIVESQLVLTAKAVE